MHLLTRLTNYRSQPFGLDFIIKLVRLLSIFVLVNLNIMTRLDLNKFPEISYKRGLLKYDPFVDFPELKNIGEVSERIYGCSRFNGGEFDNIYPKFVEKAYLRAAINEFVSISEMLKNNHSDITIEKSDIPLFHFIKELRVTNFHLQSIKHSSVINKFVIYNSTSDITNQDEYEMENMIISNCDISLFENNKNFARHYDTFEFKKTIEWVEEKQRIWGISYIIEASLKQYCELIKDKYFR